MSQPKKVKEEMLKEMREEIFKVFLQMQDRFRAVEKRLPIALLDAMAITHQGWCYVSQILQDNGI